MNDFPVGDDQVVTVCGAGLNGSLMAILLAKRGYYVRILESREDWRVQETLDDEFTHRIFNPDKRSINLSIVKRGMGALKRAGILDEAMSHFIPMPNRCIHPEGETKTVLQPYGIHPTDVLYSVSRQFMNEWLLSKAQQTNRVQIYFNTKITRVDSNGDVTVQEKDKPERVIKSHFVVGTDGAHSITRDSCVLFARGSVKKIYLKVGYKEILIPPTADGKFALPHSNALHVWPRGDCFMISMPNPDKSFTCTMIIPFEGEYGLNNMETEAKADAFFRKYFPDVHAITPDVAKQCVNNPTSPLISVWLDPFHFDDKIVMIGDAAHAVTPFFGQGANAGFEDCELLDELFEKHGKNLKAVFAEYSAIRVKSAHALTDLCIAHGKELGRDTASNYWLFKRAIGRTLHRLMPNQWIPFMTMVAFTRIPFDDAYRRKQEMERALDTSIGVAGLFSLLGIIYGTQHFLGSSL